MTKFIAVVLLALFSLTSFAAEYRIQKVKTLGPMKHKVIFQSADLKKLKKTNVLKGKLVVQWGLHVYEVVSGLYACNRNNFCKLTDYQRVMTYEKCTVKSKLKVECRKKLSGDSSGGSREEIVVQDGPDSVNDGAVRERFDNTYNDFPVRISGEFDDIF